MSIRDCVGPSRSDQRIALEFGLLCDMLRDTSVFSGGIAQEPAQSVLSLSQACSRAYGTRCEAIADSINSLIRDTKELQVAVDSTKQNLSAFNTTTSGKNADVDVIQSLSDNEIDETFEQRLNMLTMSIDELDRSLSRPDMSRVLVASSVLNSPIIANSPDTVSMNESGIVYAAEAPQELDTVHMSDSDALFMSPPPVAPLPPTWTSEAAGQFLSRYTCRPQVQITETPQQEPTEDELEQPSSEPKLSDTQINSNEQKQDQQEMPSGEQRDIYLLEDSNPDESTPGSSILEELVLGQLPPEFITEDVPLDEDSDKGPQEPAPPPPKVATKKGKKEKKKKRGLACTRDSAVD